MVLPTLSRTMASTARNNVNRIARKELYLNPSCSTRTIKGETNLYLELRKHKLEQIMQEKHENFSGQTYSFLEVKLRRPQRKM